ncbi:uncharacterized protein LOC114866244 isoform X2 [Betta splendens]|uniref:Uncharacterized protein LOC114866244 isoform X2 n=1 Tax=Betta splendens TaxID=158456 RepID=A0A6P7P102_BETSP|nr:uncharacterized protein LOC114866244 isoform X2 [Betta splendens]
MDEALNCSLLTGQQLDLSTFPKSTEKTAQDFQASVSNYVSTNKGQRVSLKKPSGAKMRIEDVNGTVYREDEDKMYAWGNFFLPDPVHMQVFAVVENASCLDEQPILMTCKDKQVYAYNDECLHLVAKDLEELLEEGLRWPAYEKYYEGDAFKHMTEQDWAKEMQSPLGKKLDEEHRELVESFEPRIMEILRNTRSKQDLTSDSTDERSCMLSGAGSYM